MYQRALGIGHGLLKSVNEFRDTNMVDDGQNNLMTDVSKYFLAIVNDFQKSLLGYQF